MRSLVFMTLILVGAVARPAAAQVDQSTVLPSVDLPDDVERVLRDYEVAWAAEDNEALAAFTVLNLSEGIMPALESSHALAYAATMAPRMSSDEIIIVNLSGRGDKDIHTVADIQGIEF